jgi:outer membrane lipoprotein-sorting protein
MRITKLLIIFLLLSTNVIAKPKVGPPTERKRVHKVTAIQLLPVDKALLAKIEHALNTLDTLKAKFVQSSKNHGRIIHLDGLIYISRKESAKLRIEYNKPSEILILGVGNQLMYYDFEVDQKSPIDLRQTPAAFLAADKISFEKDYSILNFVKKIDTIELKVVSKKEPHAGNVTLVFDRANFKLHSWKLVDLQGTETTFILQSPQYGIKIDPDIFKFWSPKSNKREPMRRTN